MTIGKSIYHYTNAKALMNIVGDNEFWVSHGAFLNDYGEITYIEEVLKTLCEGKLKNSLQPYYSEIITYMKENVQNYFIPFILSFSMNKDSITLWSEYSSFYGYSIEMELETIKELISFSHQAYKLLEGKVIYELEEQEQILEEEIKNILKQYTEHSDAEAVNKTQRMAFTKDMAKMLYFKAPFFKKLCFREEEEYRFIFLTTVEADKQDIYFKVKDEAVVPYIKVKLMKSSGQLPIKSITVGSKNNNDLAVKGTEFYLKNQGYNDVKVKKSEITLR